jgi:hypothetical protein
MHSNLIFWPVLIQIAITVAGFMLLGVRKAKALKAGNVDMTKTALDNDAWPDDVLMVSNNIRNQFQVPVLFYVLCFVFYSINAVSTTVLYLAWAFVISRAIHAYIHMSTNYVPARFRVFTIGFVLMVVMMIFAAKALLAA